MCILQQESFIKSCICTFLCDLCSSGGLRPLIYPWIKYRSQSLNSTFYNFSNIWKLTVDLDEEETHQYRYCVVVLLPHQQESLHQQHLQTPHQRNKIIVRRWETHLLPRWILDTSLMKTSFCQVSKYRSNNVWRHRSLLPTLPHNNSSSYNTVWSLNKDKK